jgi:hypothetical protein
VVASIGALASNPNVNDALLTRAISKVFIFKILIAAWIDTRGLRLEVADDLRMIHDRVDSIGNLHFLDQPIGFIMIVGVLIAVKTWVDEALSLDVAPLLLYIIHRPFTECWPV